MVLIDKDGDSKVIQKVFTSRKALKGNKIFSIDKKVFKNIKIINNDGYLHLILILNIDDKLLVDPIVSSLTIFDDGDVDEKNKMIKYIKAQYSEIIINFLNDKMLEEQIKKKIRNFTKKQLGIKPMIDMKIIRI